jgi:hypothetical protein
VLLCVLWQLQPQLLLLLLRTMPPPAADHDLLLLAGRVLFWELVEAVQVESVQAHAGVVCGLAMHPKDPVMVTCSTDGVAKVWV